jgi:hypothetical protein
MISVLRSHDSSVSMLTKLLATPWNWVPFLQGQEIFLSSTAPRLALKLTQSPIQ